jgi:hypothetical protein
LIWINIGQFDLTIIGSGFFAGNNNASLRQTFNTGMPG